MNGNKGEVKLKAKRYQDNKVIKQKVLIERTEEIKRWPSQT